MTTLPLSCVISELPSVAVPVHNGTVLVVPVPDRANPIQPVVPVPEAFRQTAPSSCMYKLPGVAATTPSGEPVPDVMVSPAIDSDDPVRARVPATVATPPASLMMESANTAGVLHLISLPAVPVPVRLPAGLTAEMTDPPLLPPDSSPRQLSKCEPGYRALSVAVNRYSQCLSVLS